MTFESIDWGAEARRLKAAFKMDTECVFSVITSLGIGAKSADLRQPPKRSDKIAPVLPRVGDNEISVEYDIDGCYYALGPHFSNTTSWEETNIFLNWDGSLSHAHPSDAYAQLMAEALFCLGLLTPEIEQVLGVTISAHEKAQLLLDYESRLGAITT